MADNAFDGIAIAAILGRGRDGKKQQTDGENRYQAGKSLQGPFVHIIPLIVFIGQMLRP